METFPVVDFTNFLNGNIVEEEIQLVAKCLHETGVLIMKDPRVPFEENSKFLDTMEAYFNKPREEKKNDIRPDLMYQVHSCYLTVDHSIEFVYSRN